MRKVWLYLAEIDRVARLKEVKQEQVETQEAVENAVEDESDKENKNEN